MANDISEAWEEGSDGHGDSFEGGDAVPLVANVGVKARTKQESQSRVPAALTGLYRHLTTYAKFIGPGFLISVAYIDPGNYATDVEAGADTRFALLFIIFLSNLIAILFQSLCIKLGSVTGRDLAQNCRAHLPRWLNIILYIFAEAAIIATDISEVRKVESEWQEGLKIWTAAD